MVDTIKFSQMTPGGDIANNDKVPGLLNNENVLFNNPWVFLPPGTTAQRPAPSSDINYRLRFNTDDQLYEYYDAIAMQWTQLQESAFTVGPFVTYTADASLPDAQNIGSLTSGILKQTVTTGISTLSIAVNGTDFYGPGFTGYLKSPLGFEDAAGAIGFQVGYVSNAVNYLIFVNNTTTNPPALMAGGTDTDVGLVYKTQNAGNHSFHTTASVDAFYFATGTAYQHISNFSFANTSATQTYLWPDASGTIALTSGASGIVNPGLINQLAYYAAAGTTLSGLTAANSATLTTDGSGNMAWETLGAGQILVGTTSGAPAVTAINSGTNILVANASGSITVSLTGVISPALGGTGVNNGSNTLTLAGTLATAGAFASTFTMTGATSVTFPTSGTLATIGGSVVSLQGTANEVLVNGTSGSPVTGTAIILTTPQAIGTSSTPTFANLILTGAAIEFTGGLTMLAFGNTASAVNFMTIGNNATGFGPSISATGSDTNVSFNAFSKGTGPFNFTTLATTNQFNFITSTATNTFNFPSSGTQTYTFPSATGTLLLKSGSGGLKSFTILTSGTAATYTTPAGITSLLVEAVGPGGGGGGGAISTGGGVAGGGGGGGGYCRLWIAAAGASYTYTVGAGGAGGTAGNNAGSNGATQTLFSGTGASMAAGQGLGGGGSAISTTSASRGNLGGGGASSGGNVNITGGDGNYGYTTNAAGAGFSVGGYGGGTFLAPGAVYNPAVATGTTAIANSGAGGSGAGAVNNGSAFAGGAGATGIIIVWEFA